MVTCYLLLLFVILQNVFDLLRERLEAKPLRSSRVNDLRWHDKGTDLEGANDMFRRDGFLRVLLAYLIRLGRNEVDEF